MIYEAYQNEQFFMDRNQKRWLRSEKKVLDHPFLKTASMIELFFGVRYAVQLHPEIFHHQNFISLSSNLKHLFLDC